MGLFEGVSFYIAEKTVKDAGELKNALVKGGGQREFYPSELVSHVISDSLPPPSLGLARCSTCPILHSDWVFMSCRCGVLLPTAPFSLREDKLFSGLVFCPSKLPLADTEKLACLVFYYGGRLQLRLDAAVTHLVTMDTNGAKYEAAVRHGVKVVAPDWLIDSIETGVLVEEEEYHPRLRGRGDHTHQSPQKASQCNGDVQESTDESPGHTTGGQTRTTADQTVPETATAGMVDREMRGEDGERKERMDGEEEMEVEGGVLESAPVITREDENMARSVGGGGEEGERLLAGLVFHLTGYLECMDVDTLSKWKEVIVQHGGSVVDMYDSAHCTHLLALHKKSDTFAKAYADGKCISSAHWLNDVLTDGRMFPPRCALHFPTAFKWQVPGADKYSVTLTNYSGRERELVKDMIHLTGIPYTGHLSRDTTYLICKSPSGNKYEKAVEWGVTVVNASFLADIIHNGQVPAVLFPRHTEVGQPHEFLPSHCFEASRLLRPWEEFLRLYSEAHRACLDHTTTDLVFRSLRKRVGAELGGVVKKQRVEEGAGPPVVLLTGISQSISRRLRETVQQLGGVVSDRPRDCTHLVAPRVARTVKFLSGVSVCRWVLTPDWIEQCEREGRLVSEEGFTLRDPDAEAMFMMDIPSSLQRARTSEFLQGYWLHATASVQPSPESLRDIIECAGGRLVSSSEAQGRFGRKFERMAGSEVQFLVLSTPEDLCSGLCTLFTSHGVRE
ncbi:PAX-interacting protein 1 [Geodia barretti]|uniref:PAX-interacting protein 1 n=3 Tax=Geodia barretti TaxID=519541 RepID=A0AA35RYK4_GEOBA|nr:PAX-interacting protein 1 [Geodia barretti]